jgi:hypothetical protein
MIPFLRLKPDSAAESYLFRIDNTRRPNVEKHRGYHIKPFDLYDEFVFSTDVDNHVGNSPGEKQLNRPTMNVIFLLSHVGQLPMR